MRIQIDSSLIIPLLGFSKNKLLESFFFEKFEEFKRSGILEHACKYRSFQNIGKTHKKNSNGTFLLILSNKQQH